MATTFARAPWPLIRRSCARSAPKRNAVWRFSAFATDFRILTEASLLPGALTRNASLHYICRDVGLKVERTDTPFTNAYAPGEQVTMPIAHKDGAYFADEDTLDRIEGEGQVVLRYSARPETGDSGNPNGSRRHIAGVLDRTHRIMGLMPHPERAADAALGGTDGRRLFEVANKWVELIKALQIWRFRVKRF